MAHSVPQGFHSVTPHLVVRDAARALEFYKQAFGAEVKGVMHEPGGRIMHAVMQIGDSLIMLNDEFPEMGTLSPQSTGGSGVTLHIYVDDVDALYKKATAAGVMTTMPVMDMFWGDRYGKVKDPFGHHWSLATHTRDLSQEEIQKGQEEALARMAMQKTA
ncbi:MAG TPA: VOC family protein [Terriglobales bacterium]|nr:VOC family protein [Terriglobales bacterium]